MVIKNPPNASDVRQVIEARLGALEEVKGALETVTVEWRGQPQSLPVISMPVDLLHYNPDTHRIRAQRSMDPAREEELTKNPYSPAAQGYLHQLLMGDPADPRKVDPSFLALKEDLQKHGQTEPGIVTRAGVLINGNTRRAALKELGEKNIRVGILPSDAGFEDLRSIELSLQLRKDYRRDYSFMNFLLAIDERVVAGQSAASIQSDFRIQAQTYERYRWILSFVRDAIERSTIAGGTGSAASLRLVDFETHQGKLEELHRAYAALKAKSSDAAEALREQRLLALVLDKSKTDLRLIEADFAQRYMKGNLPAAPTVAAQALKIPGTSIKVAGPSQEVEALRQLTTTALQAKAVAVSASAATPEQVKNASEILAKLDESLVKGLDLAGKQVRVLKRRLAPVDRLSDACEDLELAVGAVAEARATGNFVPGDVDDILVTLRTNIEKLAVVVLRDSPADTEGLGWLKTVARTPKK